VADHLHGQRGHFGFGVTLGCCAVVPGGAEVSLAQGQWVAHDPALDETNQGVVNSTVTVWVVVTHHFADDAGRFVEGTFWAVAAVEHGVDDAAADGRYGRASCSVGGRRSQ